MLERVLFTAVFLLGVWSARAFWQSLTVVGPILLLLVLWHPRFHRRGVRPWLLLAVVAFGFGLARAAVDGSPELTLPARPAAFTGTVKESPRQWGRSQLFFFSVTRIDGVELEAPLLVLVRWSGGDDVVAPGEAWEFVGRFSPGEPASYPGGFSQQFWLWSQRAAGVVKLSKFSQASYLGPPQGWSPQALAFRLRLLMLERLERLDHAEARALVAGVVFGDTQALPKEIQEQFRRTGTSHLLAASGMNVALLIAIFAAAARLLGLGPWRIAPVLIPLAVGYALLAGCAPSITRAAAAAVVGLLATWLGRSSGAWNSLCLSVLVLVLWEPRQIYDAGFQLSVAAVVGLIACPALSQRASTWQTNLLMTVSATLLTLPIIWCTFGELSMTLLPANLILGPLVELLFPLGLLLTVLPLPIVVWFTQTLARLCLVLVRELSWLADPQPLAHPGTVSLVVLLGAITLWCAGTGRARWLALPLSLGTLLQASLFALRPQAPSGELVIRQVGFHQPYYWVSSQDSEQIFVSHGWQEPRARALLTDFGCLRTPTVHRLQRLEAFEVEHGAFGWGKVHPLLPKAPYIEVRTDGVCYQVRDWRP